MDQNYPKTFHANGKLLITGEYLVLKGAKALAIPLNKGQSLKVYKATEHFLSWKAYTPDGLWLEMEFDQNLEIIKSNNSVSSEKLKNILQKAILLNPKAKHQLRNKAIETQLEFKQDWGWGSSSSLIALLSQWLDIDAFQLLDSTFGGSGYDIACAINNAPLTYQLINNKPKVELTLFEPKFKDQLYFIYSGQKQNSQKEVKRFNKYVNIKSETITKINDLTDKMIHSQSLDIFGQHMEDHERLISNIVEINTLKGERFSDFDGYIKSLGAWGGDFFMAASEKNRDYVTSYFNNKGIDTIFKFDEVVLKSK